MSTVLEDGITMDGKYRPAMKITEEAAADEYFEACVNHCIRMSGVTRLQAEVIEKTNLAYFAGYFDEETRRRVERLFNCVHPFFGSIKEQGAPEPDVAFNMGIAIGEAQQKRERTYYPYSQPGYQQTYADHPDLMVACPIPGSENKEGKKAKEMPEEILVEEDDSNMSSGSSDFGKRWLEENHQGN